jgi:acetyl esterase/lipase
MPVTFDDHDLAATRRSNRALARMPRLKLQSPIHRNLVQGLIVLAGRFGPDLAARRGVHTEDRVVAALGRTARVRILRPPGSINGIHVYIHGGGWTIGSARLDDAQNAELAIAAGVGVVSVEYRLTPAYSFADGMDDCETAARWALEAGCAEFGVDRMTIGGESAGGHLAAVTILRLRDAGFRFDRVAGAVLTYGCFDLGGSEMRRRAGPETLVLHGPTLGQVLEKVTGLDVEARRLPALSPLYADLSGLPPALFVVGTRDPLQEDSEQMQAKWERQSGNAELVIVPEAAHGFNHQANSTADKTNAHIRAWVKQKLISVTGFSGAQRPQPRS